MPQDSGIYRSELFNYNIILMKKILFFASVLMALASCHGTGGEYVPDEYVAPFTLEVDKAQIEASGSDWVNFVMKDSYGRNILEDKYALQRVNIYATDGSGVSVKRMDTRFRAIADASYTFEASYSGNGKVEKSANTVTVEAVNRSAYEKYHKNVAIYKATATWCGPCAVMTSALASLDKDAEAHSVELCWHGQDDLALTLPGMPGDCGSMIISYFGGAGFPTVVFDANVIYNGERSGADLSAAIWNMRADYPATCGIKLSADHDSASGNINIQAELTSSKGGKYDLGFAILLNNQHVMGGTNPDGLYNNIVCATTPNFYKASSDAVSVGKDQSHSWSQTVPAGNLNVSNLSVVAYALVNDGNSSRIDNIVEVKVGESIDYILN